MKAILMVLVVFSIAGCSNRAVYENIQLNNRNECAKLSQAEYDECMASVDKSYEDYERERQELE